MKTPVFRLPPYTVKSVVTSLAETIDWGLVVHGIPDLWKTNRGAGVRVAVLDTGVDKDHPDLKNQIAGGKDFTSSRSGWGDLQGHGTHCAGVIGGLQNEVGVVGICPDLRQNEGGLYIGKVLGDDGSGSDQEIAAGIRWAVEDVGADVISMSLGSPDDSPQMGRAIDYAVSRGCIVIAAAGNDGRDNSVGFPGRKENVCGVGAVDKNGRLAAFSSRGPEVDVCAPGQDVLSAYPGGRYAKLSGTSMATLFVAGVVALMLSKDKADHGGPKTLTPAKIRDVLKATAKDAGPSGFDEGYGWGLIDPRKVLETVTIMPGTGDIEVFGVKLRFPAELDGHTGLFIYTK